MRKRSRRRMTPLFKPQKQLFHNKKNSRLLLAQLPEPSPLSSTAANHQVVN